FFFFQAEDGIRDATVTGVQTCALPIWAALHALHHLPQAAVDPLRTLDFAAEIREVERDVAHIPALLPTVGEVIGALLDRAQEMQIGRASCRERVAESRQGRT